MLITKAYLFRLKIRPKKDKAIVRALHHGCASSRYAYNWCLALLEREWDAAKAEAAEGEKPETVTSRLARRWAHLPKPPRGLAGLLYRELCKHRDEDQPWQLVGVHSHTYANGPKRVVEAQKRWFQSGAKSKKGRPRFKRRGEHDSFTIQINRRCLDRKRIRIPGIGWVYVHHLEPDAIVQGEPISLTVTRRADYWECSVTARKIEIEDPKARRPLVVGIDLGLNAVATVATSDGAIVRVDPPLPLARKLAHLAELQRRFALRKDTLRCDKCKAELPVPKDYRRARRTCPACEEGHLRRRMSNRAMRLKIRIGRLHYHVAQIRKDHLHQVSHRLLADRTEIDRDDPHWSPSVVVVEGFDVRGLVQHGVPKSLEGKPARGKRRRAARRAMLDVGWGELRRQLSYKAEWRGVEYLEMPKDFATNRTCHACGHDNEVPDDTSEYACAACGIETTRQENTAKLLVRYGEGNEFPGRPGRPGATRQQEKGSTSSSPNVRESAKTDTDRHAFGRGPNGSGDPGVNNGETNETYPGGPAPGGTRKSSRRRKPIARKNANSLRGEGRAGTPS